MTTLCNNPKEHITPTNGGLKDNMLVYVRGIDGRKLMPCTPAKARKLLRDGKAKPIKRVPFTIQLLFECENQIQDVVVGIDKGAKITGFACIGNGKLLMGGEINHRQNIKIKMDERRTCRRARRFRKWYRKPRFLNKASSRRKGRIPPSVRTNVEEVIRVINKIPLPISSIRIEDVQIDIAKLNNPNLYGNGYQKSNRLDENLRLATLVRDNFQCQSCKKKNIRLEAHHIVHRSKGGKDTIKNLITLCKDCHDLVHDGKIDLKLRGISGFKDRMAQQTMQGKTYMYSELSRSYNLSKCFGYETSAYRKSLDLSKSHVNDAICIATLWSGEIISDVSSNCYNIKFRAGQNRKQYYTMPRKDKGRVRYQVNDSLGEFKKGDLIEKNGFLKVIRSICSNGILGFYKIRGEPTCSIPDKCRLIEKASTVLWSNMWFHKS